MLASTGKSTNVVYKEVLCWIFILRTHIVAVHRRGGRDVTLAFSGIINIDIFVLTEGMGKILTDVFETNYCRWFSKDNYSWV
jgi:hypothetical protein